MYGSIQTGLRYTTMEYGEQFGTTTLTTEMPLLLVDNLGTSMSIFFFITYYFVGINNVLATVNFAFLSFTFAFYLEFFCIFVLLCFNNCVLLMIKIILQC